MTSSVNLPRKLRGHSLLALNPPVNRIVMNKTGSNNLKQHPTMPVKDLIGPSRQLTNTEREELQRAIQQLEEAISARPYKLAVACSGESFIKKIVRGRSV